MAFRTPNPGSKPRNLLSEARKDVYHEKLHIAAALQNLNFLFETNKFDSNAIGFLTAFRQTFRHVFAFAGFNKKWCCLNCCRYSMGSEAKGLMIVKPSQTFLVFYPLSTKSKTTLLPSQIIFRVFGPLRFQFLIFQLLHYKKGQIPPSDPPPIDPS